jgi:transcriptional regulator with XRE-family HTH domain
MSLLETFYHGQNSNASNNNAMKRFGGKLHQLRISHAMTLKQLASSLGYSTHSYLSEIEAGHKAPTLSFVLEIARLFDCTTDQLLKDELEVVVNKSTSKVKIMTVAFIEREPTIEEIEKLRLILSTYQDGSGMLAAGEERTLPGWRDFERAVAVCFSGIALESKAIYDVLIPVTNQSDAYYGISCKMRNTLRQVESDGRVTIELSNAAGEFWDLLKPFGIHQQNYEDHAQTVGQVLLKRVGDWHKAADIQNGGMVITDHSIFLSLQYNRSTGNYQLFQFSIQMPDPDSIDWTAQGRHLIGKQNGLTLIEWYGFSGGQLKYYPHVSKAKWVSQKFQLQPLPKDFSLSVISKVELYWPELWSAIK